MTDADVIGTEDPHEAARRSQMMPAFRESCARAGIPLSWALAIARGETHFQNIRSAPGQRDDVLGGAWGPMQVTSETARVLGYEPRLALAARGKKILSDPAIGISLGCMLLARIAGQLRAPERPDFFLSVACAYNCGAGRVLEGRVPNSTAQVYGPRAARYQAEYGTLDAVPEADALG